MEEPSYTSRRGLLNLIIGMGLWGAGTRFSVAEAETAAAPDGLSAPETVRAAAAIDGDTFTLSDGGIVRLAGIEAPKPRLAPDDPALAALAQDATAFLTAMVGNREVMLRSDVGRRDRYGRRVAQVFAADGTWLQGALVEQGHARVHGDPDNRLGLRVLMRSEA